MVSGTVLKFPVIVCFISLKVPRIVVTIINHHFILYSIHVILILGMSLSVIMNIQYIIPFITFFLFIITILLQLLQQ